MSRVVLNQFATQWATFRRPRSFLGSVAALVVGVLVLAVALVVLAVALVLAIPAGLAFGAYWWARGRLRRMHGDGRRNVRVVGGPASPPDV